MDDSNALVFRREDFYTSQVERALEHQGAIERQAAPLPATPISRKRRLLLSNLFYTPLLGLVGGIAGWGIIEPSFDDTVDQPVIQNLFFPAIIVSIVVFIHLGEGLICRRWWDGLRRAIVGAGMAALLMLPGFFAGSLVIMFFDMVLLPGMNGAGLFVTLSDNDFISIRTCPSWPLIGWIITRSIVWACIGLAGGAALQLVIGTKLQVRNALLGGSMGGAFGGMFFDVIDRFIIGGAQDGYISRAFGVAAVGASIGFFVALGERLSRVGWLRVRTGPLAGKAFILHRDTTRLGSAPGADIYLFKDADIAPTHAAVHQVGSHYEVEDLESSRGTMVNQVATYRRRLVSGDQITIGATVLEFEERSRKSLVFKTQKPS